MRDLSDVLYVSDSSFPGSFPFDANFRDQDDDGQEEVEAEDKESPQKILYLHLLICPIVLLVLNSEVAGGEGDGRWR